MLIHSSRTYDALDNVLTMFEKENSGDLYLYNLLCEQSATPTKLFPYRGFTIINRQDSKKKLIREIVVMQNSKFTIDFEIRSHVNCVQYTLRKCPTSRVLRFGLSTLELVANG